MRYLFKASIHYPKWVHLFREGAPTLLFLRLDIMSLDKAIDSGREHRKRYYKRCFEIDYSCRNHGGKTKKHCGGQCPWCLEDRLHKYDKEVEKGEASMKDYEAGNLET